MKEVHSSCMVCLKKFNVCLANDENLNPNIGYNNFYVFCQHLCSSFDRRPEEKDTKDKLLLDFYYDSFSFCKSCTKLVDNLAKLQKKMDNIVKSLTTRIIKTTGDRRPHNRDDDFPRQKKRVEQLLPERISRIEVDIYKYYKPQVTLIDYKVHDDGADEEENNSNVDPLSIPDGDYGVSEAIKTENINIPSTLNSLVKTFSVNEDDHDYEENVNEQKMDSDGEDSVDDEDFEVKEELEECSDDDDDYKPEDEAKCFRTRNSQSSRRKQKSQSISAVAAIVTPANPGRKRGRPPAKDRKQKIIKSTPKKLTKAAAAAKNLSNESDGDDDQDDDMVEGEENGDTKDKDWNDEGEIEAEIYRVRTSWKTANSSNLKAQKFPTVTIGPGVYRYGKWEFRDIGNNVFKCQCGHELKKRYHMYRHLNVVHVLERLRVKKVTEDDQGLFHYEGYTFEKINDRFKCGTCGKTNKTKYKLVEHINMIHNVNKPRCVDCGGQFMTEERLKGHKCRSKKSYARRLKFVHLGGDNYIYDGKWKYQKVTTILADGSVGVSSYKCGTCGVERNKLDLLSAHIRNHHAADTTKYVCEICGYSTPIKGSFDKHQRIHSDVPGYICDVCGKSCKTLGSLRFHNAGHRAERYKCPKCDKTFQYQNGLRRHCVTAGHELEKVPGPVSEDKCPRCGRVYSVQKYLEKHMEKCGGATPVLVQKKLEDLVQKIITEDVDEDQQDEGPTFNAVLPEEK